MSLNVTWDMSVLYGKNLVGYNFNYGNEYVLHLEDREGNIERVRIPAALVNILNQYREIEYWGEEHLTPRGKVA